MGMKFSNAKYTVVDEFTDEELKVLGVGNGFRYVTCDQIDWLKKKRPEEYEKVQQMRIKEYGYIAYERKQKEIENVRNTPGCFDNTSGKKLLAFIGALVSGFFLMALGCYCDPLWRVFGEEAQTNIMFIGFALTFLAIGIALWKAFKWIAEFLFWI